ncbi:MAG: GDP-mannose 4,6-dehydratase [Magnetococcales bacterium]|nr:GDP-mannose 4,6-dehydratase [Magnetococcales bacterium]
MKYLITGGCGFLGSNLAAEVLRRGESLVVFDNLSRLGSESNLAWLRGQGAFRFERGDMREAETIARLVAEERPEVVFHLSGQVTMTRSIADPVLDFQTNALGAIHLLEAVRHGSPGAVVVFSSTNKVYGDLEWVRYQETERRYLTPDFPNGFDETLPLDFRSPYGCSKGSADQYMLDYARIFGLRTIVFRHSSMYGSRQFASFDQGWVGWFCQKAVETSRGTLPEPFTITHTGKQVRDLLHAEDMIRLYFTAVDKADAAKGLAFNIGGGMANSLSLLQLFDLLDQELGIRMVFRHTPRRESDQFVFVADIARARKILGWEPRVDCLGGIRQMVRWCGEILP